MNELPSDVLPGADPPPPRSRRGRDRDVVAAAVGIGALGTFAMHAVLPALSAIRVWFDAPLALVQLLISLGLLSTALGNLVAGALSDRFGRRRVVLGAIMTFSLCAVASAFAPSLAWLLAARVVQSFSAGAAMAVSRASLNDHFGMQRAATAIAYAAMAILLVPMFAPSIGGLAVDLLGWRANFVLLALLGAGVSCYYALRVPETLRAARTARAGTLRGLITLLRNPAYLRLVAYASCMLSAVYALIAGAPHVLIDLHGESPTSYGLYFMVPAGCSLLGFAVASRITGRVRRVALMRAATLLALTGCAVMVVCWLVGLEHPLAIMLPGGMICFANSVATPAVMSGAIGLRSELAGAASGLLGFVQLAVAAANLWLLPRNPVA